MNKHAKNALAMLLVLILALSAAVSAFAYNANSEDITGFYASIDSYTIKPELRWFNIVLDSRFISVDEEAFTFTLTDSLGNTVTDEAAGRMETFTPSDNEGFGFEVFFYFDTRSLPVINPNESYCLTVPAGIFSADNGEQSAEYVVSFAASEFISTRTGFFGFLDKVYNTPYLRVLFAPLIAVVELIYYISVTLAMM